MRDDNIHNSDLMYTQSQKESGAGQQLLRAKDDLLSHLVESPRQVMELFRGLEDEKKVKVVSLKLDERFRVVDCELVGVGSDPHALLVPRVIVRGALDPRVRSIILVLNHTEGSSAPTAQERAVVEKIKEVGETLGFHVLDLVIVTKDDWSSLVRARRAV